MTKRFAVSELASYLLARPSARIVFVDAGQRIETTYAELHELVLQKGRELARLGVRSGDRVGLIGPASLNWMAWDLVLVSVGAIALVFADEHVGDAPAVLCKSYDCFQLLVVDADGTEIFSVGHMRR